ncbi:MAG: hypothetical protein HGB17_17895, partial [Syntrophobacteraceae bacterium]|nr:hypothetical protein [Syntrophobacteraceae bacterium]
MTLMGRLDSRQGHAGMTIITLTHAVLLTGTLKVKLMLIHRILWILTILPLLLGGCVKARFSLFPDSTEPLEEYTIEGSAREKILVVPIRGMLADSPRESLLRSRPSVVQEVVSHLRKAEEDEDVKALLLKVDSPGGTV